MPSLRARLSHIKPLAVRKLEVVERKLATVLFVDLVDSTEMVAAADPEVVRRRVSGFFERASRCIEQHGGTVEKFAGDAVMAAFGVPQAHEDDAERAVRAAFAVMDAVHDLGLEARAGVEAGEVVVDESDSTFATGEAVNFAARLQQAAGPGEIVLGPGVRRLTAGTVEVEDVGPLDVKGRSGSVWTWRALHVLEGRRRIGDTPFVGREDDLELLHNTYTRVVRERRAHLVTVYGEPGVGKSRLVAEFVEGVERATVLRGRALPYGEGVTYWPLASMIKASAGIDDDDPANEAFEKLRLSCESEAVADLLAVALGVLGAAEAEHTGQEIAWAAVRWARQLSDAQPLVLVFEDVHWADERLLDLIDHLGRTLKDAPVLIVAIARHELAEEHPGWGGGNPRAAALDLAPLGDEETEELASALLQGGELPPARRALLLEKAEGNPLFLEETVRMLLEGEGGPTDRIPDTVQALIAARIDRLPQDEKRILQRAAVMGRVFWRGALDRLSGDLDVGGLVDRLLERDLVVPEERSTISGDRAFRFRHVLIREVAYASTTKAQRAGDHRTFAEWLSDHAPEELVEIRAFHLDRAAALLTELDGSPPRELARDAAAVLEEAGRRAIWRESYVSARRLFRRAVELDATKQRQFEAARAAWRLGDLPAVALEMQEVADTVEEPHLRAQALAALADVTLHQTGDVDAARALADEALGLLDDDSNPRARFDVLAVAGQIATWLVDLREMERLAREELAIAQAAERQDLEAVAIQELGRAMMFRLDVEGAEPLYERAAELAAATGSAFARAAALELRGWIDAVLGDLDAAAESYREVREIYTDLGYATAAGKVTMYLGKNELDRGDLAGASGELRDAIRILKGLGERGFLAEAQRSLAQVLVAQGRLDEAERVALEARETVGTHDRYSKATTALALGTVRAAQGRDEEAESLLREAVAELDATEISFGCVEVQRELATFLRSRGRDEEADEVEQRRAALVPTAPAQT
jgi:class 3 adenylate cyclase/tetratricopeptide (TPR) repeat protein